MTKILSKYSQKIWSLIVITNIFYLLILFIFPRFGYTLKGGFYTTLIIGLFLLFITGWFTRPQSLLNRESNQKRINIFIGILTIAFSFNSIIILLQLLMFFFKLCNRYNYSLHSNLSIS